MVDQAGVDTLGLDASLVRGTVWVDLTLDGDATLVRVSHQAGGTTAEGRMVPGRADGVGGTRIVDQARVHALVQVANLVITAVWIHFALD